MKVDEREVIQKAQIAILNVVRNPVDLAGVLFERGCLSWDEIEEVCKHKSTKQMIDVLSSIESKCSLFDIIDTLKILGEQFEDLANDIARTAENSGVTLVDSKRDAFVYEKVRKVDVYTNSRKGVEALGHHLKRLSHEGDKQVFENYVKRVDKIFRKNKKSQKLDVAKRMEIADMRFTCLEAEVIKMRVFYDESLYQNDIFKQLEKVIPYTSNPTVTSMTFLARYGSARSMNEGIETGLAILQYSKHHAENIVPCRDSGMVYYIEINLLMQIYEKTPSENLKKRILKTADFAISQFEREPESVQNDYKRMLLLKMVFCRLGIGLFGNRIPGTVVKDEDMHAAKNYLEFVELPEIWKGMETRRQMLFHLAKAEFYRRQRQTDMAVFHAREAHRLAEEKQWKAELPPINTLLTELEGEMEMRRVGEKIRPESEAIDLHLDKLESKLGGELIGEESTRQRWRNSGTACTKTTEEIIYKRTCSKENLQS